MMFVHTTSGRVSGDLVDGVAAFSGIRYGQLSTGHRFDPVAPASPESRQDLRARPAVFPQLPSRLGAVMGTAVQAHPQEEDAFLLNVWAPADATGLPVMLFIHGGAFVSGGGGISWYDGSRLALEGNMVVVTVNYRLGPLAHLTLGSEHDDPNRAVGDLIAALRWVHANIGAFGGDPDRLTVAGQSAGGFYSQLLAVMPETRDMVRRLFLMSSPGIPAVSRATTDALSAEIIASLDGADPRTAPVESLLMGHLRAMLAHSEFGSVAIGLMPTVHGPVPDWLGDTARLAEETRVTDLLITYTRDETASFFFNSPERDITATRLRAIAPGAAESGSTPYEELISLTTAGLFGEHAGSLAAEASKRAINTYFHEFTVMSPLPGLGSGHCLDLPFLFGNRDGWPDAPMLDGMDDDLFETESRFVRRAVTGFVHDGVPTQPDGTRWQPI